MFTNPFSGKGRIRRTEYGLSYLLIIAASFILGLMVDAAGPGAEILFLLMIPIYWFQFAQGAKRCHDRGNSVWYQLIPFYPLWMLFGDSDPGLNKYGMNPKGIGNPDPSSTENTADQFEISQAYHA